MTKITSEEIQTVQSFIQQGRRSDAAAALRPLLNREPGDYRLWLLLALIAPAEKKAECIRHAEQLAPDTAAVIKAKTWLESQTKPAPQPLSPATAQAAPQAAVKPAPPIPSPTSDLDRLRQKSAAQHVRAGQTEPRSRRRWLPLIAIVGLLFAAVALVSGWGIYSQINRPIDDTTARPMVELADAKIDPAAEQPTADMGVNEAVATPTEIPISPTPTIQPPATATPQRLLAKKILASSSNRERWTPTPTPTNTPIPTPTVVPTVVIENFTSLNWPDVGPSERWVDVNLTNQTLVAYEGKSSVMETVISSGRAPYYTVTGQFRIYYRLESQTMDGRRLGFDYVTPGVPWVQYFYGDFALHGAFWHNDFGVPVSHGCVNLTVSDAEWLYGWADYGTMVNVHY